MKKKLFTLFTFLVCLCSGAWGDTTYEYYYNGTATINTSSFFSGTSFSTDAYTSSLTFSTTAGTVTASKVAKMNSSGYVDFTTTANSTVTIVMMSKAKTASGKANTVKLDSNTSADFGDTETAVVISDPIVFENVAAGSHRIVRGGQECGLVYVKVVQEAMTAPAITTQPASNTVLPLNGTTTLTIEATPSSGSCTYNWYVCDKDGVISGVSLGTSASYVVPTSATASAATLYYCCVVGDGGSNTTPSDVAKIQVLSRAAKQTWDFTTIDEEDIKYNESFWTRKSSGVYNHGFTKATDGTLQDNYGNDLLNGIKVRRDAGDAQVYVYTGRGINHQGTESKPGIWKIPVVNGKYYKITYTSQTDGKTIGYTVGGDATYVCGDLTATITTRFTNNANFTVKATSNGTLTLTNKGGDDANCCTIVKIEEVTSVSKTISAAGWATYCSPYALDFTSSIAHLDGAYIITGNSGASLTLSDAITTTVPANTGLLLKGNGAVTIPVVASGAYDTTGNKLVGVTADTKFDQNTIYVLMNEAAGVGFYKNGNAEQFTVGANTAYLPVGFGDGYARSFFSFDEEETTGIEGIANSQKLTANGEFFDLQGRRVAQPTKGLYIVNGKKVVIK